MMYLTPCHARICAQYLDYCLVYYVYVHTYTQIYMHIIFVVSIPYMCPTLWNYSYWCVCITIIPISRIRVRAS